MTARPNSPALVDALDAFYLEHRLCGELGGNVAGRRVCGRLLRLPDVRCTDHPESVGLCFASRGHPGR